LKTNFKKRLILSTEDRQMLFILFEHDKTLAEISKIQAYKDIFLRVLKENPKKDIKKFMKYLHKYSKIRILMPSNIPLLEVDEI